MVLIEKENEQLFATKVVHLWVDEHFQERGHWVHAVKDGERQSDVHDGGPDAEVVEFGFGWVVELRASAKCRHDPKLELEKRDSTNKRFAIGLVWNNWVQKNKKIKNQRWEVQILCYS